MDLDLNVPQSIHTAKAIVEQQTNLYVSNLLTEIANDGIDFDNERCLFIGGGSKLPEKPCKNKLYPFSIINLK